MEEWPRSPGVTTVTTEEVVLPLLPDYSSFPLFLVVSFLNEGTKHSLRSRSLLKVKLWEYTVQKIEQIER